MLLTGERPQALRTYRTEPRDADRVAREAVAAARAVRDREVGCEGWAVHLSHDRLRVVTVEAWRDAAAFRAAGTLGDVAARRPDTVLYRRAGTGGADPTPVGDPGLGVTVIDVFPVRRPLVGPVSAFTLRNGAAFGRQPGCVGTTVLRGLSAGRIATYARWRTTGDFLAAFTAVQGTAVDSTAAVDAATARLSRGLLRTDYHVYDLVDGDAGDDDRGGRR